MRKLLRDRLILFVVFIMATQMMAQNINRDKADTQFKLKAYDLAIDAYQEYLTEFPDDIMAMERLAASYERSNDLISSARWYEKVVKNPTHNVYHDIKFGKLLMKLGLYDRAGSQFKKIEDLNPIIAKQYMNSCEFAKNILSLEDKYIVSQLKTSSPNDDFAVEIKKGNLIFCSFEKNIEENQSLIQRKSSKLFAYNKNTKIKTDFTSGISNLYGIGPIRYSPSGKYVIYTRNSFINGTQQITGDENDMSTYMAEVNEAGEFVNETAMPFNGVDYSTAFACFGEDDDIVYYSSNKENSNYDIYSAKKVEGVWTDGQVIEKLVNTVGNEITPYFVGGTLYFSSDYHNGLGGYDVFKTTVYKNEWSYPVNLGKGVNSSGDDLYFVKEDYVSKAYITSNRLGSKGGYDIYSIVPVTKTVDQELVYEYIPEAVDLTRIKDINGVDVKLSNAVNVSSSSNSGLAVVSLDGAKMIAYDDVILSPSRVYFIQLASLSSSKVSGEKFKSLTKYGNVYKVDKGRTVKVRLGYFVSRSEAKAVLVSVKKQGYRDAFIVEDLLNSSELELLESDYTFGNNRKYNRPAEVGDFKIKLAAYTNPLYFDVNKVKDLGVIEQWSKGKWTIFILSGYKSLDDASTAMRKARNRGFATAKVVVDENGILSNIKSN